MPNRKIKVATRSSLLAYTQTKQTVNLLKKHNPEFEFEIIKYKTQGDKNQSSALTSFSSVGVFVKELETALLKGEADIAVHSLKDVPNDIPQGLGLYSFPKREVPFDVFISKEGKNILDMPEGFVCGTGAPRRMVQLAKLRPDIVFKDIRGNIDTRLKKMEQGEYDAIILAAAGLKRIGRNFEMGRVLKDTQMLPAVGQGIIGIECRKDDKEAINVARMVNHMETEMSANIERMFMKVMEAGCRFPLAVFATLENKRAKVSVLAGKEVGDKIIKKVFFVEVSDNYLQEIEELALKFREEYNSSY